MTDVKSLLSLANSISEVSHHLYAYTDNRKILESFRDHLSPANLKSKTLLIEQIIQLKIQSKNALFIAHWFGLFPHLLNQLDLINKATGIELDPIWTDFSNKLNSQWDWKSLNINFMDFEIERNEATIPFDLFVNTSCEHMPFDWIKKIPSGRKVIAQSSNFQIPEHTNTIESLNEFEERLDLNHIQYSVETNFEIYKRFTVIGIK